MRVGGFLLALGRAQEDTQEVRGRRRPVWIVELEGVAKVILGLWFAALSCELDAQLDECLRDNGGVVRGDRDPVCVRRLLEAAAFLQQVAQLDGGVGSCSGVTGCHR